MGLNGRELDANMGCYAICNYLAGLDFGGWIRMSWEFHIRVYQLSQDYVNHRFMKAICLQQGLTTGSSTKVIQRVEPSTGKYWSRIVQCMITGCSSMTPDLFFLDITHLCSSSRSSVVTFCI